MIIRPATMEDKTQVLEFTKDTWDGYDYISLVYDKWISELEGEFTVMLQGSTIVACSKMTKLDDETMWLEGMRVHPEYRRKGYSEILAEYQFEKVKEMHVPKLQLSTYCENKTVQMLEKKDFELIGTFKHMWFEGKTNPLSEAPNFRVCSINDLEEVCESFKDRYLGFDWTMRYMSKDFIIELIERNEIYRTNQDYFILSNLHQKEQELSFSVAKSVNNLTEVMSCIYELLIHSNVECVDTMNPDRSLLEEYLNLGMQIEGGKEDDVYHYSRGGVI